MRIAVISDVHANCLALEAVLEDIALQRVDAVFNLGDMVAGPLEPRRTADMLMDANIPTVSGNHETGLLRKDRNRLGPIDRFALGNLRPEHLDWFRSLPPSIAIADVFLCHGTPESDTDPWLDNWWTGRTAEMPGEREVTAKAGDRDCQVLLCGHTHLPRAVRLRDGRLIVNPGSVGLQMNHGAPDARYAIVEQRDGTWSATFRTVVYDWDAAARQAVANGFPRWADALSTGWSSPEGLF
jgi:putative phosphoesterase